MRILSIIIIKLMIYEYLILKFIETAKFLYRLFCIKYSINFPDP